LNKPGNKKRILIVVNVDWFFLSHRLPIALEAKNKGFDVYVAAADTGKRSEIESHDIHFINAPFLEKSHSFLSELNMILRLGLLYRRIKPDLVHHVTIRPVLYGGIASRLFRVEAVVNALSGLGYVFINQGFKNRIIRRVVTYLFKLGFSHPNQLLILQNNDDREKFIDMGLIDAHKIKIIRGSGVDTNIFKPEENNSSDRVIVAFIGRLLWDKGIGEFVEAAKRISTECSEVSFHIFGAQYENNPMSVPDEVINEWESNNIFTVHGQKDQIEGHLKEIDIVCLPSYREGLPKALLEAAAAGLPIVTTDTPGCREVVDDGVNGFLVPPRDTARLTEKLKELIQNPQLRAEFGKEGRKKAQREFTIDKVVDETMNVYRSLLS
jgi:glycosyltransferase involved in cell wall biosynthesis